MSYIKKLFWIALFSIAMGFLESAVVIYLRQLYYPGGFSFPLLPMPYHTAVVELWREAATIVMLLAVGVLAGASRAERIAWFLFAFAIWDLFYYVFLYVFIAWPSSLLTWDILFLLPVPWVGPVLAPCIIAVTMIALAAVICYHAGRGHDVRLGIRVSLLLAAGSLVCIYCFTADYIHQNGSMLYHNLRAGQALLTDLSHYIPQTFNWAMFAAGEGLILGACLLYGRAIRQRRVV